MSYIVKRYLPDSNDGFAAYELLVLVIIVAVICLVGYFVFHKVNTHAVPSTPTATQATSPTPTSANSYAVLSPATVSSKAPECTTPITFQSDGNSGPIQCTNGDLNATEWNALSALEPSVMSLGYSASASQVQSALCADANASNSDANTKDSFVVEQTVYQISALYYGWSFPSNPSTILSSGSC